MSPAFSFLGAQFQKKGPPREGWAKQKSFGAWEPGAMHPKGACKAGHRSARMILDQNARCSQATFLAIGGSYFAVEAAAAA